MSSSTKSQNNTSRYDESMGNGEPRDVVVEDGPVYRSIMMQPLVAPPLPRSFSPPPPMKFSKPTATATTKRSLLLQDETTGLSPPARSSSTWKVVELTSLPSAYLLERTNVYVDALPQVVADRICDCLRLMSFASTTTSTVEDDDNSGETSTNILRAETQDCVKFSIRLFQDKNMVVVEVQRTSGCSYSFREASRAVLRSAKGLQPTPARKRFTIPSTLPPRSRDGLQQCVRDDYEIAYSMLHSGRADSQELALDSFEQMTRLCAAKDEAAKAVLSCDCFKQLIAVLEASTDNAGDGFQSSFLRRKVLAVLANACAALSQADLAEVLSANPILKERSFLSLLLLSVKDAPDRPHDAYHAVRCLQCLLVCKDVEGVLVEMSAMDVMQRARTAGSTSHSALEDVTHKLIAQLQNAC